jgi:hypothetical protein
MSIYIRDGGTFNFQTNSKINLANSSGDCDDNATHFFIYGEDGANFNASGANDQVRICGNQIVSGVGCNTDIDDVPIFCDDIIENSFRLAIGDGEVIGANTPLPITLVSFSAKIAGSSVKLFWATASEYINDRFEVLRSLDGREFEKIGEVKGSGTTSILTRYEYKDERPFKGVSYYRLKQIDTDGTFEYLPVVAVNTESTAEIKGIYPK